MGANEDFKRLAKEMAEKARAQREKAAKTTQARKSTEDDAPEGPAGQPEDRRAGSERK